MLAPNGQGFSLRNNKKISVARAAEVLSRCSEEFEAAVDGKALFFEVSQNDAYLLKTRHYHYARGTVSHVKLFINEALTRRQMPYKVRRVLCPVGTGRLYCGIERVTTKGAR